MGCPLRYPFPLARCIWVTIRGGPGALLSKNLELINFFFKTIAEPEDGNDEDGVTRYWEVIYVLNAIDTVCVVYFTLEYLVRFLCAPRKFKFLFQAMNLVDLFAITPFFLTIFLHQLEDVQIIGKAGKIIRYNCPTKCFSISILGL